VWSHIYAWTLTQLTGQLDIFCQCCAVPLQDSVIHPPSFYMIGFSPSESVVGLCEFCSTRLNLFHRGPQKNRAPLHSSSRACDHQRAASFLLNQRVREGETKSYLIFYSQLKATRKGLWVVDHCRRVHSSKVLVSISASP
jgi:hypothetical protein